MQPAYPQASVAGKVSPMFKRIALPVVVLVTTVLALAALPTFSQDRPHTRPSTTQADGGGGEKSKNPISDKLSVTEHELRVGDHTLKYRATAGHMPLKDEAGKLRANFFFVAYERTGEETPVEKRPITFVFNGGPGAAAIWLHLGTAGPKRVDLTPEGFAGTPPYHLVDNPTTWLNQTDLVFIDPVGTGYSRAAEGVKGEEFYGVQQDLDSVSEFIRLYLVKTQRWASPKFIAGESYGTTRAALLSEHLLDAKGIALNGVVLISTVLSFQAISPSDANELPYELFFPTYTACAHYHKKLPDDLQKQDLAQTLKEVEKWVRETYSSALLAGDRLTADQRKSLVSTISRYTGLPEQFVEKANLRVSPFAFEKALMEDQRKVIGRFDGRVTGSAVEPLDYRPEHDPSLTQYVGVYAGTFNNYVRGELKFESDLQYEYLTGRVQPWNWGRGGNGGWLYVGDNLRNAIVKHPTLKVLVCSGHYDLATPYFATDYAVSHLDLAPDLRKNIRQTYYEGGHMLYHHLPDLEKLNKDVADFMAWAQTPATQPSQR
jgi:carboxypeptidase C (cathepsin A)